MTLAYTVNVFTYVSLYVYNGGPCETLTGQGKMMRALFVEIRSRDHYERIPYKKIIKFAQRIFSKKFLLSVLQPLAC